MITPLRTRLDELEVYVTRVAEATGIPPAHLEKDFWVTEVLRGASNASEATGCSVIFKGGTSLSKAHRIIRRFSEDIDLVVVLPESSKGAKDSTLKTFVAADAPVGAQRVEAPGPLWADRCLGGRNRRVASGKQPASAMATIPAACTGTSASPSYVMWICAIS